MRIQASLKNSAVGLLMQSATILIGLVSQSIFIKYLGIEYAGVSSVLNNIISMLSIAELGIGTAIVFSLYEPLANNNKEKLKSLMHLYKTAYQTVGIIIAIVGIFLLPFLKFFFKDITIDINLKFIYFLYLGDTVISYFFTYKRSLLYADQKNYVNGIIDFLFLVLMNVLQIVCIVTTRNYYYYVIIRVIVHLSEYLFIVAVVNRRYPFIKDKHIQALGKAEKTPIIVNIKALFFHKIGRFLVLSTDNLIVSSMINVATAGIFNNYKLISKSLQNVAGIVIGATTASFGNLLVDQPERSYEVFRKIYYVNFIIAIVFTTCYACAVQPFMKFFAGSKNLFSMNVVLIMSLELYIHLMRNSIGVGRDAAGIYHNDRFVPLWESAVNLISSIALVKVLGVSGVVLGTIISTLVSVFISVPYLTYKYIYHKPLYNYYLLYCRYFLIMVFSLGLSLFVTKNITIGNYFLHFVVNGSIGLGISFLSILLFTSHSEEYRYVIKLLKTIKEKKHL
ncbi:MAG: hypothetical protein LKE40_13255 [Spirochaetia bacterium]|jgi:O-antigen/teichoic acid export membrane protein|nr:hypothetical protein [Spirochaetia bacterium]